MNESRSLMTKRTFGLLSMISVLSVTAFTAALVLAYPNPNVAGSSDPNFSDTQSIDASRTVANTYSTGSTQVSSSQGNATIDTSDPSVSQSQSEPATTQPPSAAPTQTTAPTETTRQSSSPQQSSASSPQQNTQPVVVTVVRDVLDSVADLLPL